MFTIDIERYIHCSSSVKHVQVMGEHKVEFSSLFTEPHVQQSKTLMFVGTVAALVSL